MSEENLSRKSEAARRVAFQCLVRRIGLAFREHADNYDPRPAAWLAIGCVVVALIVRIVEWMRN